MPRDDYRNCSPRLVKSRVGADGKNLANYKGTNLIRRPIRLALWIIRSQREERAQSPRSQVQSQGAGVSGERAVQGPCPMARANVGWRLTVSCRAEDPRSKAFRFT
jgi:hypothetical protein